MKTKIFFRQIIVLVALFLTMPVFAYAQNSTSNNYQVFEAQFGSGGIDEQCSGGQYCAQGSLGANAVGRQSSANFDAEAGVLTQNAEFLEFVINDTFVELGELTPTSTGTGTADFYIRSYISSGYSVVSFGNSLESSTDQIDPLTTTDTSQQGTKQFGINLVDNSNPDIGANFQNIPDGSFADGSISTGYEVADQFRFVSGEPVVQSPATAGNQGVGRTDYTVSYIANVDALTPAGTYLMRHDLIAIAAF
jgi:hypothetical protein